MNSRDRLPVWVRWLLALGVVALGSWWAARGCRSYWEVQEKLDDVDARIEGLLPIDDPIAASPQPAESGADVVVTVVPVASDAPSGTAFTVRLGERTWRLAYPGEGASEVEWTRWNQESEPILAEIAEAAAARRNALDLPARAVAEIRTPIAGDASVPPGLVVRVLDCLVQAGLEDVRFVSAPRPPPLNPSGEADPR